MPQWEILGKVREFEGDWGVATLDLVSALIAKNS